MPTQHTVKQGECITSIADKYGLFWETVWNHAENAELKQQRQDPNILQPGDVIHIPDKEVKEEDCATEQKHRFRKKGIPAKLKVRIMADNEPLPDKPYSLYIDDRLVCEGTTDGDGFIEASIPPNAREGEIRVGEGDNRLIFPVSLGTVNPIDTDEGVAGRLHDLGYPADEDIQAAIQGFQQDNDLEPTGEMNDETRDKLREVFGQ
ncbi:MAG: LysM peptidoglycan-binding domain-containing protein [Sedimentisphaerales bacterium]|nr:LysM peptidoglycan-binding domain-containing protein [Sedimentisphaerales bacterium]